VVQVLAGREDYALNLIERMVPRELYSEAFLPRYERRVKREGEWSTTSALLVPGYLYVTTEDIDALNECLRSVPTLSRVLGNESQFVPLNRDEIAWLNRLTDPQTHTVSVSTGVIEGDQIVITDGPLKGYEAQIQKVDRHKRVAEVQLTIMGREKTVKLGLEIVSKTVGSD
jgi:transcriptional antiterminator NusG